MIISRRKLHSATAVLAFVLGAALMSTSVFAAESKEVQKTVPLNSAGSVSLTAVNGSIRISTWDRNEVEIHAVIEAASGSSCDRKLYDATNVHIDSETDSVRIVTDTPNSNWCREEDNSRLPVVRFTIQMPRTAGLTIRDHNSDIEIANLQSPIEIETHNGKVRAEGLASSAKVVTHNGDVRLDFAKFGANSSVETDHGSIELLIPKGSGFNIRAGVDRRGSFSADFPVTTRISTRRSSFLDGTVNGGGPTLELKTDHGSVHLRAK